VIAEQQKKVWREGIVREILSRLTGVEKGSQKHNYNCNIQVLVYLQGVRVNIGC